MEVTMTNLQVKDTDFYFDGDLRLLGNTEITNGSLVVTGNLVLAQTENSECSLHIINGDLTAKDLWLEDFKRNITDDFDTFCDSFIVKNGDIHITDGSLRLGECDINDVCNIFIDGGYLSCGDILDSFSIYVEEEISARNITTIFDLHCYDGDFYGDINCGRDMYVENQCNMHDNNLYVKGYFETSSLLVDAGEVKVGK